MHDARIGQLVALLGTFLIRTSAESLGRMALSNALVHTLRSCVAHVSYSRRHIYMKM